MQLIRKVSPDRSLLVVAVPEEAQFLDTSLPVLLTGMGKVNAANALAAVLGRGPRPARVVNLGTAGALRPGMAGIHVITTVIQHDFSTDAIRQLTGRTVGAPIAVADGTGITLATGDSFVADGRVRARLARRAQLVDMEGYALAMAAASADVPIQIIKYVSDDADEHALTTWQESVAVAAGSLADWAALNVTDYGARGGRRAADGAKEQ